MKARNLITRVSLLLAMSAIANAMHPAAPLGVEMPAAQAAKGVNLPAVTAFGDFGDFRAAGAAAADYLVAMQADMTEDNAGNGNPDTDPDDGGWPWATTAFEYDGPESASYGNLYGVTALGLYENYLLNPTASWYTAMKDAADNIVSRGPAEVRSASDITFLLKFAGLGEEADPSVYVTAAEAIWAYRLANYGDGTATGFAAYLRDVRGVTQNYPNGIIPWDISAYCVALMELDAAVPGMDYADDAAACAAVMWEDSFNGNPGLFDPDGYNQGFDPNYGDRAFWWYSLGVSGLISGFNAVGGYETELAQLETLLLDCQYDDGGFSDEYGLQSGYADWQDSAYAVMALGEAGMSQTSINQACWWLAATQHSSGGFVYDNGTHYPEVGGECAAALTYGDPWGVGLTADFTHIAENDGAPYRDEATVTFDLAGGAEAFRSVTFFVAYDASVLAPTDVTQIYFPANSYFIADTDANPMEITLTVLGLTDGLSYNGDIFSVGFDGISDGTPNVDGAVSVSQIVMRDPDNASIYTEIGDGVSITVDDEVPAVSATTDAPFCVNGDFDMSLTLSDNVDLGSVDYRIDGGSWVEITTLSGLSGSETFTVPTTGLATGDHTLQFQAHDAVGYSYMNTAYSFHLDIEAPVAATDLAAMPAFHAVTLSWTAASDHDGYKLYRHKRDGYPYAGGLTAVGTFPGDFTLIDDAIDAGDTSYTDDFGSDSYAARGVYDYVLVAADCAEDNAPAATAVVSATNYFLGDWADGDGYSEPYDGFVCMPDLNFLGLAYGDASAAANEEMDMAPTSDYSRFGLPGPDGTINFEDLIVLAMNFRGGCTDSPLLNVFNQELAKDQEVNVASGVELAGAGTVWSLLLDGELLGYTASIVCDAQPLYVTSNQGMAMSYATTEGFVVDVVGLAELLGEDTVVEIHFADNAQPMLDTVDGRNELNESVMLESTDLGEGLQPATFNLAQNHPNPFNPTTTISYSLAADGAMRLTLYNALGQVVRVLDEGNRSAGQHQVTLDASGLASGVYLYRLEAEGFTAQKKMVLLK